MRRRARIRWIVVSLWRAGQRWVNHECVDLSAAFAYFTLQSIFPLLLIALSVFANGRWQQQQQQNGEPKQCWWTIHQSVRQGRSHQVQLRKIGLKIKQM